MDERLPTCVICQVTLTPEVSPLTDGAPLLVSACDPHAELLREELQLLLERVRRELVAPVPRLRSSETVLGIRTWARAQGIPCSSVGPVSRSVLLAYRTAVGTARSDDHPVPAADLQTAG